MNGNCNGKAVIDAAVDSRILDDDRGPGPVRVHRRIYGEERPDGTWAGWIEFVPAKGSSSTAVLRTGQETSQPDQRAVEYWARGLEPIYLEGALQRAE